MTVERCPLCADPDAALFADLPPRTYFQCATCALVFLDPSQRPTADEERAEYDLHENDPSDSRYRKWLSKLTDPLLTGLDSRAQGLDFGSGPGPTISVMLEECGYTVRNYDPFYAPDSRALNETYDFISCSETAEHFHCPADEFTLMARLMRPGGRLGVMTQMLLPGINFATWRYRLQPSHVVFYSPETMNWLAQHFGWHLELLLPDVVIFTNPEVGQGA